MLVRYIQLNKWLLAELDGAQQLSSQEVDTRLNEQPLIPEDYTQLAVGPDALRLLTLEDDKQPELQKEHDKPLFTE